MKKYRRKLKAFVGPYSKDMRRWPSINPNIDFSNWEEQRKTKPLKDIKSCKKCGTLNFKSPCAFCKK